MPYDIPLFKLNYDQKEIEAVVSTIESQWISMGPRCEELEALFREQWGVKYACSVTNCTAALHLACYALGIGEGDEVICPALTFAATVNCIRYVNATPVFCDIVSSENLCIDPEEIERLITSKTKAIIVMHYAGFPCDMDRILDIAHRHGLYIIEDACHGPLSEYNGSKLGTIGDIGCFSFYSNKNISTGEGGMIVTNDEMLYTKCKLARSHGMTTLSYQRAIGHASVYDIKLLGFNYRYDDIRASLAITQLAKLPLEIQNRKIVRERYIERLRTLSKTIIPFREYSGVFSNYIFPIVLSDSDKEYRDYIRDELKRRGIQTSVHYQNVKSFSVYSEFDADLKNTDYVADNEISLPMFGSLSMEEIDYICDELIRAVS